jgi:hypothetical protein
MGSRSALIVCLAAPWVFFATCGMLLWSLASDETSPEYVRPILLLASIGQVALAIICPLVMTLRRPSATRRERILVWIGLPLNALFAGWVMMAILIVLALARTH